jgi:GH24 family phage-related lysozyme (muramidase)
MARQRRFLATSAFLAATLPGQTAPQKPVVPPAAPEITTLPLSDNLPQTPLLSLTVPARNSTLSAPTDIEQLRLIGDADMGFDRNDLIRRLNHFESMVLTAYPDPKTHLPLIGAGFSLRIAPKPPHVQIDTSNPVQFIEPQPKDLWVAAGLDPKRFDDILTQFDKNARAMGYNKLHAAAVNKRLPADISPEEADRLTHVAIQQSVHNAWAYYSKDKYSALKPSQKEALAHMVFQMGVNLEGFVTFLNKLNDNHLRSSKPSPEHALEAADAAGGDFWETLQRSMIHSKWFKMYRKDNNAHKYHESRAIAVLAMLDPHYENDPDLAERKVLAMATHENIAARIGGFLEAKLTRRDRHELKGKPEAGHAKEVARQQSHTHKHERTGSR